MSRSIKTTSTLCFEHRNSNIYRQYENNFHFVFWKLKFTYNMPIETISVCVLNSEIHIFTNHTSYKPAFILCFENWNSRIYIKYANGNSLQFVLNSEIHIFTNNPLNKPAFILFWKLKFTYLHKIRQLKQLSVFFIHWNNHIYQQYM